MSKSDEIRLLASKGLSTADIARRLGIRYQHAYNVLNLGPGSKQSRKGERRIGALRMGPRSTKPPLHVEDLAKAGFQLVAVWMHSKDGSITPDRALPREVGVYAFVKDGIALYVGVATMGLAKRIYFYARPGVSQRTSVRINAILKEELKKSNRIEVHVAMPTDLEWNGLPVHGSAGLELGLIKKYALPWNKRSAG